FERENWSAEKKMSRGLKIFIFMLVLISASTFAAIDVRTEYMDLRNETEARLEQIEKNLVYIRGRLVTYNGVTRKLLEEEYADIEMMKEQLEEKLYYSEGQNAQDWQKTKREIQTMTNKLEGRVNNVF